MTTKIEWVARSGTVPETWNLVGGCTKKSPGCANCYAIRQSWMKLHHPNPKVRELYEGTVHKVNGKLEWTGRINLASSERLEKPLRWRKPRTVFVCSMGDLFHEDVSFEFVERVFGTIGRAKKHTFLVLTKRPRRMFQFVTHYGKSGRIWVNTWLGVTAENQATADERIPLLLQTPAAVRFVSCEPLLGEIDISDALNGMPEPYGGGHRGYVTHDMALDAEDLSLEGEDLGWQEPEWQQTAPPLDWVIVGGESGPGARPMHPDWARSVVQQCRNAGVPVFIKQMGTVWAKQTCPQPNKSVWALKDHKGNQIEWWPQDLRVREFPLTHNFA